MAGRSRWEWAWGVLAKVVCRPAVRKTLKVLAMRRPYGHLMKNGQLYMARYWLFNPYRKDAHGRVVPARWRWLPSIRLHYIASPDKDLHEHCHPWLARTIILSGCYLEARETGDLAPRLMDEGDTSPLSPDDFHRICWISSGGVWSLFFTWDYALSWGFMVDGEVIDFREYEKAHGVETTIHPGRPTPTK